MENLQGRTACTACRIGGAEGAAHQRSGWWACRERGKTVGTSSIYWSRVGDRRLVPLCRVGHAWGPACVTRWEGNGVKPLSQLPAQGAVLQHERGRYKQAQMPWALGQCKRERSGVKGCWHAAFVRHTHPSRHSRGPRCRPGDESRPCPLQSPWQEARNQPGRGAGKQNLNFNVCLWNASGGVAWHVDQFSAFRSVTLRFRYYFWSEQSCHFSCV